MSSKSRKSKMPVRSSAKKIKSGRIIPISKYVPDADEIEELDGLDEGDKQHDSNKNKLSKNKPSKNKLDNQGNQDELNDRDDRDELDDRDKQDDQDDQDELDELDNQDNQDDQDDLDNLNTKLQPSKIKLSSEKEDPDDEIEIEFSDDDGNTANNDDGNNNDNANNNDDVNDDNDIDDSRTSLLTAKQKKSTVTPEIMPKMTISAKKEDNLRDLDNAMLESLRESDEDAQTVVIPKKIVTKTRAKTLRSVQDDPDHIDDGSIPSAAPKKPRKKTTGTKVTTKKGPGRPRKTPKKEPLVRKGISKTPTNVDDHIEFLYDQPVLLKKIFQFFKSLAAAQIQIMFRPKDVVFYAEDHHKKSRIRIRIDASKLNHYYCKSVLDIGVASKDLELILNKVDKEYSSVVILSSIGSTQRSITLVLDNDIQIDEIHTIDLIGQYNKMENEEKFTDEDYAVKFQLPSKYFKKTIGDIKTMSSQLSITQEDNESPLVFEYLTPNKKIQSKHTVKDSNKIKLTSNLESGESFRVDVKIDYIKPISAAQIADEVIIMTDENKAFMTKAYIDNEAIEIKTLTEIIDDRPDDDDDIED